MNHPQMNLRSRGESRVAGNESLGKGLEADCFHQVLVVPFSVAGEPAPWLSVTDNPAPRSHQPAPRSSVPGQPAPRSSVPHQPAPRSSVLHQPAPRLSVPHQRAPCSSVPSHPTPRSHQPAPCLSVPPHQLAPHSSVPHQSDASYSEVHVDPFHYPSSWQGSSNLEQSQTSSFLGFRSNRLSLLLRRLVFGLLALAVGFFFLKRRGFFAGGLMFTFRNVIEGLQVLAFRASRLLVISHCQNFGCVFLSTPLHAALITSRWHWRVQNQFAWDNAYALIALEFHHIVARSSYL